MFDDEKKPPRTKTVINSLNPVWEEEFRFDVSLETVSNLNLKLKIWDDDTFKDDAMGEVIIPLWQVDFSKGVEDLKPIGPVSKTKKGSTSSSSASRSSKPTLMRPSVNVSDESDEERRNDPANIGRLKYSLTYDPPTNKVILEVIKARVS